MKGVAGFFLHVDLSACTVKKKHVPEKVFKDLVGGNGLAMFLLSKYGKPKLSALHEKAPLVFVTGPLTGSGIPGSGMVGCYAKSPLTGFLGEAWCGSRLGVELKQCGFDALVVTGKARSPVNLVVEDGRVSLKKSRLWGEDTYSAEEQLRREFEGFSVTCIGPAGEAGVAFACIKSDLDGFSRFGLGAVMGSKNLKSVVVKGSSRVIVHNPVAVSDIVVSSVSSLKESALFEEHGSVGTASLFSGLKDYGGLPVENFNKNSVDLTCFSKGVFESRTKRLLACHSCSVPCRRVFRTEVRTKAGVKVVTVDGPSFDSLFALGANLGIFSVDDVARLHEECDRFGLDVVSAGSCLGFAMELSALNLIDFKFDFGNVEHASDLLELIALKRGLGGVLAGGVKSACVKIGVERTKASSVHVKGLELTGLDPRCLKGAGLAFAVSQGSDVPYHVALAEVRGCVKGLRLNPLDVADKGIAVKLVEDKLALFDCLPLCRLYADYWGVDVFPALLKAVTGEVFSDKVLFKVSERVCNLERLFNLKCGLGKGDDWLPEKVLSKPLTNGGVKGERLTSDELERMISDYFKARGWTSEGVPTKRKLSSLGINANGFLSQVLL